MRVNGIAWKGSVLAFALIFSVPLYLLITISLKSSTEVYVDPFVPSADPYWSSFSQVLSGSGSGSVPLFTALVNSAVITVGSVVCLIAVGSIAAYSLARHGSRLSNVLYFLFLIGIIIPAQLGLVPLYVALRTLRLLDSYVGMILLYTGLLMPLTVFLYAGFIRALPRDYEEAAQVDGATRSRTYVQVVLPLLLPITGTVAVLTSLLVWNDFFVQLVFLSGTNKATLPVVVYTLANANFQQWNLIFAAAAISMVPIIIFFMVAQRTMIRGFTGGIRG